MRVEIANSRRDNLGESILYFYIPQALCLWGIFMCIRMGVAQLMEDLSSFIKGEGD